MSDIVLLVGIPVLILIVGAILGFVSFFKVRRLEDELRKTRLEFSQFLVRDEIDVPIQEVEKTEPEPEVLEKQYAENVVEDAPQADEAAAISHTDESEPKRNLEETIGSLWAVWVGGLALAFGAVFLVKFSIEKGLLGPGVRIILGLVFSALLVTLGEWGRRRGEAFSFSGFSKANIPAILTAAGTMGAFATIYAAYELYNMLPPFVAFLALGLIAVGTSFAALLHGPLLAALGLLASFVVPILVSTNKGSVPGLATYIIAVSASGFVVGRLRYWKWLAVATAIGMIAYGLILLEIGDLQDRLATGVYLMVSWAMIAYVFVISLYEKSSSTLSKIDKTATALLTVVALVLVGSILYFPTDITGALMLVLMVGASFGLAYYYSSARAVIYGAMAVSIIGYIGWDLDLFDLELAGVSDVDTLLSSFQVRRSLAMFTWLGVALAAISGIIGFLGARGSIARAALAIGGAFLPLLVLGANYLRIEMFSSSWSYAFVALAAFAGFMFLSNYFFTSLDENDEGRDATSAAYAVAGFVALALGAGLVLERGALTIALALLVPAIAFVYTRRHLPALRPLAAIATLLWIGRVIWDPRIVGSDMGTTPLFNWLTYGYGIPTLGFALAAWLLGRTKRDKWLEVLEAVGLASLIATLGLVGLHAIDPAQVFTPVDTLEEVALMTIIGGGAALGLLRVRRTETSYTLNSAVTLLGFAGMFIAAVGLLIFVNPWFSGDSFGSGKILNGLLFGYFVTGILYLTLGWYARSRRSLYYVNAANVLGALLLAAWVNLTIRHLYHPAGLSWGPTYESELYTYSIVWLVTGIIVLGAGIYFRSKLIRLVSVGILMLVVGKVFLIDMAGLEGILRALSFIGLGATLIGIGLVYQRVLSRPDGDEASPDT